MPIERPILFSGPMVRAMLEGRKTVTRRAVKGLQIPKEDPKQGETRLRWSAVGQRDRRYGFCVFGETEEECAMELGEFGACPYGRRGDRLWVRESTSEDVIGSQSVTRYTADGAISNQPWWYSRSTCPSIHMPRIASRILLEITDVRVERLQDISEEQAVAEGVERPENIRDVDVWDGAERELFNAMNQPRDRFKRLWASINGAESWNANPWVWVVEFKRVTP